MATIRASCLDCGDVEVNTKDISIRVCRDDNTGSYHFRCPHCAMVVVKSAEPRIVDLLVASGVELTTWRLPSEVFEPHSGNRINHDDLLDFHEELEALGDNLAGFIAEAYPAPQVDLDLTQEPDWRTER